jgi:hypothetical protein
MGNQDLCNCKYWQIKKMNKMKTIFLYRMIKLFPIVALSFLLCSCERDLDDLSPVSYPANPEVFIDGFSSGLNYAAFGGSVPTAFDVDTKETYNNSAASMRIDVPDAGDPRGAYAGGAYFTESGRDLSGFNALTFWAKASQSANIDVLGFGNDLGENKFQVSISNVGVNTSWTKYIIPIPDPARLKAERGMFFYSEGPEDGKGYTFWLDEVKFEKLGTIAHPQFTILNGEEQTETSFVGVTKTVSGLTSIFNMPTGINQAVNIAPAYFDFSSSDASIASVDDIGQVTITGGPGSAVISARVGDTPAEGSLTIQSQGAFQNAPEPEFETDEVISLFSDFYDNHPVNYYNGYWAPFQTTLSADFEVAGDYILHYTDFNFVGIEFSAPTIDASGMTNLYMDLFFPNALPANGVMKFEIVDEAGGTGSFTVNIPAQSSDWIRIDKALDEVAGLSSRSQLFQLIFVNESGNISSFYADNILFYNSGSEPPPPVEPASPAPTPTHNAADVMAVFSDAYTDIPANLNPDWGQATVVSTLQIQGNNTLKFANLNYQGIELGSSQDVSSMEFLHLDFWSANSTALNIFLISPGPVETAYTLQVPTDGWVSLDIPLSAFSPVALNDVIQLKFDGNGDIYLDNIYFRK